MDNQRGNSINLGLGSSANFHSENTSKGPGVTPIPIETLLVNPELAKELNCGICLSLLNKPHQCKNGHLFCVECISKHLQKNNPVCPQCRCAMKKEDMARALYVEKQLFKLQVYCKNHFCKDEEEKDWIVDEDGCMQSMNYEDANNHEKDCEFARVRCRFNPKCDVLRKKELEKHEKKCPYRPVECQFCKQPVERNKLDEHLNSECKMTPTVCNKCNLHTKRGEIEVHRRNQCPEELICCTFQGCETKVLRKMLHDHVKEDSSTHLFLLRKNFEDQMIAMEQKFEKEMKVRDEKIRNLEKSIAETETRVEWKVKNWSMMRKKSYLQSDKFTLLDFSWFIGFYTDGDNEESRGFISVYLFMDMNNQTKTKNVTVEFMLKFVNHKDSSESIRKEFKTVFPIKGGQGWGDRKAVKAIKLTEEGGFIKSDTLTIEAQMNLKKITWML